MVGLNLINPHSTVPNQNVVQCGFNDCDELFLDHAKLGDVVHCPACSRDFIATEKLLLLI